MEKVALAAILFCLASANALQLHSTSGQHSAKHKTIHLLSQGRSGSCFMGELVQKTGIPYVFEPDIGDGWGLWKSMKSESVSEMHSRMKCLYNCEQCDGIVKDDGRFQGVCESPEVVAIKTVHGLSDVAVLHNFPEALGSTKFVLMLRDPRGMNYTDWGIPTFDCKSQALLYLSAKELLDKVPRDQLRVAHFEHWSQKVETFVPELFEWGGLKMNDDVRAKAVSTRAAKALEWTSGMSPAEKEGYARAPFCDAYMKLVGYPSHPSSVEDYAGLKDPFAAPLTASERSLLSSLRFKFASLWNKLAVGKPHNLPPFLMNVAESDDLMA